MKRVVLFGVELEIYYLMISNCSEAGIICIAIFSTIPKPERELKYEEKIAVRSPSVALRKSGSGY